LFSTVATVDRLELRCKLPEIWSEIWVVLAYGKE